MKAASVTLIKKELEHLSEKEKTELILRLARFKKDNKELLTYLLFESENEFDYIHTLKRKMEEDFEQINHSQIYFLKKSARKILRNLKKAIRYSGKKSTEAELLIFFCKQMNRFDSALSRSTQLQNIKLKQMEMAEKAIQTLHEDLQYDLMKEWREVD